MSATITGDTLTLAGVLLAACANAPPGCRALDDRVVCEPGPDSPTATIEGADDE